MYDDNKGIEKEMELERQAKGIKREHTEPKDGFERGAQIFLGLIFFGFMGFILWLMFNYVFI